MKYISCLNTEWSVVFLKVNTDTSRFTGTGLFLERNKLERMESITRESVPFKRCSGGGYSLERRILIQILSHTSVTDATSGSLLP